MTRRQYVPIDSHVAFGRTGTALEKRWGTEGLGVWVLFLAASKREPVQGTFTYASEEEAWAKLGTRACGFSFEDFLRFTGQLKQTRRRRSGRLTYVTCTHWGDWNDDWKRQTERERNSRKRQESRPDTLPMRFQHKADRKPTEGEGEGEGEGEVKASSNGSKTTGNLPVDKQLLAAKLKAAAPVSDDGALEIDLLASLLPEGSLAKVLESVTAKAKRDTIGPGYVIAALRSERDEMRQSA